MRAIYPHDRLVNGLAAIADVSRVAEDALRQLPLRMHAVDAHRDIVVEGDHLTESCILLEGVLCRYRMLGEQRQIMSFHLAGDLPDLQSLHLDTMDYSLGSLTPSVVALVQHTALRRAMSDEPQLVDLLWRATLTDAAAFRAWMAVIGRKPANERIAHLFCELYVRMTALGIAEEMGFELPLSQSEIADALALSPVHVNRTLQDMRRGGLIRSDGKRHVITDWERLRDLAGFDPRYLHLRRNGQ